MASRAETPHRLEPVKPRQHDVEQHDVELVRIRRQPVQRHLTVFLDFGGKAFRHQVQPQPCCEVFFVLDDQHTMHHDFSGSSSVKVLPFPAPLLSA